MITDPRTSSSNTQSIISILHSLSLSPIPIPIPSYPIPSSLIECKKRGWNDAKCNSKAGYICQRPVLESVHEQQTIAFDADCNGGVSADGLQNLLLTNGNVQSGCGIAANENMAITGKALLPPDVRLSFVSLSMLFPAAAGFCHASTPRRPAGAHLPLLSAIHYRDNLQSPTIPVPTSTTLL